MIRTVHVVEDDDAVRASLQAILSIQEGMVVRSYHSAEMFLDGLAKRDPGVLLLDFQMRGKSGLDVLRALQGSSKFVTIMLTGQGDIALAVQAMKAGAVDFMEKPCEHTRLLRSVDDAFRHLEGQHSAALAIEAAKALIDRLSKRERDVVRGLICGWPNKVIAQKLNLSPRTVEIHRANMMEKLQVRSLSEALRIAFTAGLTDDLPA